MQRFFVDPTITLVVGTEIALPPPVTHQVGHVLRLRPSDRVILLDNSGDECEVELIAFTRDEIRGRVLARQPAPPETGPAVTLYQCMLKGEKFGWVLQKATELGVAAIVPVASARTVAPLTEITGAAKGERWERVVREAAEQSRRVLLPRLYPPLGWRAAVAQAADAGGPMLVPWEEAPPGGLGAALDQARQALRVSLFIGPEGGLTAEEVADAAALGATPISLGPRVLRAETAALAALALLLVPC